MTAMSTPPTCFRIGFALGTLTRELLRAMKRTTPAVPAQPQTTKIFASTVPTRKDWDELCRVPTIARRGIDLSQWFEANTKPVTNKRRSRQRKPAQCKPQALRFGPLDELIAPIATV